MGRRSTPPNVGCFERMIIVSGVSFLGKGTRVHQPSHNNAPSTPSPITLWLRPLTSSLPTDKSQQSIPLTLSLTTLFINYHTRAASSPQQEHSPGLGLPASETRVGEGIQLALNSLCNSIYTPFLSLSPAAPVDQLLTLYRSPPNVTITPDRG